MKTITLFTHYKLLATLYALFANAPPFVGKASAQWAFNLCLPGGLNFVFEMMPELN